MKLTTVLLIASLVNVSAAGLAQQINLKKNKISLPQLFSEIKKQTGFRVVWDSQQLKKVGQVSVHFNNTKLTDALDQTLAGTGLEYTITDRTIVIREEKVTVIDRIIRAFSDSDIRATVVDEKGVPLIGATIRVKGTNRSTNTNDKGEFYLAKLDEAAILEVSFIGFRSREVSVKEISPNVNIVLKEDASKLDEVAIEAYREGSQRLSTSSIGRVTSEELAKQPVQNPLQALMGRIPGVVVSQTTGVPGARVNVQVRGRANFDRLLTNDQPLFIIDGVPMAAGNDRVSVSSGPFGSAIGAGLGAFAGINTADIESISVLKDADATSIYGSRGANGVILITTKKGKAGPVVVNANVSTGASVVSKIPKMLNTEQYLMMRNEAFANDKLTRTNANAYDLLLWDNNRYTNFAEELIGKTAHTMDAQVNVTGGGKTSTYRVGGAYHREGTVYPGDSYADRASANFNNHSQSENGRFTMDFSGIYSVGASTLPSADLTNGILLPPNFRIYDEKGQLAWNEGGFSDGRDNPLAQFKQEYRSSMSNLNV
ncbi:SusC/RagA family TonB-linked outer membrane protein [Pararcticibacter amylolyticus]|nr:SusC/RagA family TonB-linked outer membrane protein [Pararcticibacter amylolyticus]